MDVTASSGSVGAVASQARFQVEYQGRVLKEQLDVIGDLGANALKLIQSAVIENVSAPGHDLDVLA